MLLRQALLSGRAGNTAPATAPFLARRRLASSIGASAAAWGYVTDVEGDFDFWRRFCSLSAVLEPGRAPDDLALRPGCHLVFGGDSVDKGGDDLAFLASILRLKSRHPDRVHLLMGNRDINKMRLSAELGLSSAEGGAYPPDWAPARAHPGVYWRQGGARASPHDWLAAQPVGPRRADNRVNRLRWMLEDNMGSPRAFEGRRAELASSASTSASAVSDAAVLESYVASLRPGGAMRSYLQQAQLAVVVGETLFVHGGLRPDTIGVAPGATTTVDSGGGGGDDVGGGGGRRRVGSMGEWVEAMNAFAASQVAEWCADADAAAGPSWPGAADPLGPGFFARPGGRLMAYAMANQPGGERSPTVVYSSFLDDGQPVAAAPEVVRWLDSGGISTLVVGHQPHGDAPVIMRCAAPAERVQEGGGERGGGGGGGGDGGDDGAADAAAAALMVVTADTSFSGATEWVASPEEPQPTAAAPPPPGHQLAAAAKTAGAPGSEKPRGVPPPPSPKPRGCAVLEVCGGGDGGDGSAAVRVHGRLSDGRSVDFAVGDDPRVGTLRGDGWWVKGLLPSGELLLSRGKGYVVQNCVAPCE